MKPCIVLTSCIALATAGPAKRQTIDCTTAAYSDIILTGFNVHRANHSVPDFTWNDTLASFAETTATTGTVGVHDK
jgi:uncharacterized protein YkwD